MVMNKTLSATHRDTIFVEQAEILSHQARAGEQYILKLRAAESARRAKPGMFVHLQCDPQLPMRRPLSIMRVDATTDAIELLYKVHGFGTELLAGRKPGEEISVMGPIGRPFKLANYRPRPLLIGGGVGIPPMVFLAEHLKTQRRQDLSPLVIMGSEVPFPFRLRPSTVIVPGIPAEAIAAMPLMEDWGIPSRLASLQGYPGCFDGYVTDLARAWIDSLDEHLHQEVEIFACGPTPMLQAVAKLAGEYDLPSQLSLEEYMACAVGGCAGCTVEIRQGQGTAMRRVCVDGPVFEGESIIFS